MLVTVIKLLEHDMSIHIFHPILLPIEYFGIFNRIFISNHELLQIRYRPLIVRQCCNHIDIGSTLLKSILIVLDDCYAKCMRIQINPLSHDFFVKYWIILLPFEIGNNPLGKRFVNLFSNVDV